jgi:Ca2+-binding EF-hand superfamily protein
MQESSEERTQNTEKASPIHLHLSPIPRRKLSSPQKTLFFLPQLTKADELGIGEDKELKISPRITLQQQQLNRVQSSLQELQKTTHFGELELKVLFSKYTEVVSKNQGKMNKELFVQCCQELLKMNGSDPLIEQYYKLFDKDDNGLIDFREFVTGASILLKGTPIEKMKFIFSCYDINRNGTIEKCEMRQLLSSMFNKGLQMLEDVLKSLNIQNQGNTSQNNAKHSEIMQADIIAKIVDSCFAQANGEDVNSQTITEEQFINWVQKNEQVMKLLSPGIQMS